MSEAASEADLIRVVLADANVLCSHVLPDYLLYAADQEIIAITWSAAILAEAADHLMLNVVGFDRPAARSLVTAMNRAFPFAEVEPAEKDFQALADVWLPDEDDRHVLAAAVAAEATVLCTWNIKDFPADAAAAAGVEVLTPDELLLTMHLEPRQSHGKTDRSAAGRDDPITEPGEVWGYRAAQQRPELLHIRTRRRIPGSPSLSSSAGRPRCASSQHGRPAGTRTSWQRSDQHHCMALDLKR